MKLHEHNIITRLYESLKQIDVQKLSQDDKLFLLHAESLLNEIVASKKYDK